MAGSLPRWVFVSASLLALTAGVVNAVGFLGFEHHGVTHLTGTTTQLGIAAGAGEYGTLLHLAAVMTAFVSGCAVAGFIVRDGTAQLGRRYGVALLLESSLLVAAVLLLRRGSSVGDALASFACGVQNGMVSTWGGAVIRTTHVTGSLTDLGVALGHALAGLKVRWDRVRLFVALVVSFGAGGAVGAWGFARWGSDTLLGPAALTGVAGASYFVWRVARRRGQ